jgi:hypothetical protein
VAGQSYLIRIGGFEGEQGVGMLTVLCDVEVCGAESGPCFEPNGTRGCEDPACCDTTCAVDPYCCDVVWDDICAAEASGLCTGSFEACGPGAGPCNTGGNSPGCDDTDCCNLVCMTDPFCCVDTWDEVCVEEALGIGCFTCGGQTGGCFIPGPTPGCEDVECCQSVCAEDPFCCSVEWDQDCSDLAATECR